MLSDIRNPKLNRSSPGAGPEGPHVCSSSIREDSTASNFILHVFIFPATYFPFHCHQHHSVSSRSTYLLLKIPAHRSPSLRSRLITMLDVIDFINERGGDPNKIKESQRRRCASEEAVDQVIALYEDHRRSAPSKSRAPMPPQCRR